MKKQPDMSKHLILEESRFYRSRDFGGFVSAQLLRYWRMSGKVTFKKIHGRYYYLSQDMAGLLVDHGVEVDFI